MIDCIKWWIPKKVFVSFLKLHLFSIVPKGELYLCSHPAESMHKPKVHVKGRDPGAKLVVRIMQSSESQASVRRGLDWRCMQPVPPRLALREACPIAKGLFWCPQYHTTCRILSFPRYSFALCLPNTAYLPALVNEGQGDGGKATFSQDLKPPTSSQYVSLRDQRIRPPVFDMTNQLKLATFSASNIAGGLSASSFEIQEMQILIPGLERSWSRKW